MLIDVHTHIFTPAHWASYQKKLGRKDSHIITLPWYDNKFPHWPDVLELLKFTQHYPQMHAVGSININQSIKPQLVLHEKLFKQKKIVGIKLYPGYQHFYPCDQHILPIARLCAKYHKPLIFHSGDLDSDMADALLKYIHPEHIDELALYCPETKIIISHFGFPYFFETAMTVVKNKNVYTDISGTIDECPGPQIKNLTRQYITDLKRVLHYFPDVKSKLMFGTDYCGEDTTLNQVQPYLQVMKKILTRAEQEHAFHKLPAALYLGEK